MDRNDTLEALRALAQETRLEVFRLLLQAGSAGLAAGEIGRRLGVLQNTLSSHLAILSRAGLIGFEREGRVLRYRADFETTKGLLAYLLEDCCGGQPARCQPLLSDLLPESELES